MVILGPSPKFSDKILGLVWRVEVWLGSLGVAYSGGRFGGVGGGMNAPHESGASFPYRGQEDRRGVPMVDNISTT